MNPIRIHLGSMSEMLRTIIGDLLRQESDIVVVGRSCQGDDALESACLERADVLITQDRLADGCASLETILSAPPICIFALSDDGTTAEAVDLVRRPIALNDNRPSALADAVRQMAEHLKELRSGWDRQRPA